MVLKNKLCKCISHKNFDHTKIAAKQGNAEERPDNKHKPASFRVIADKYLLTGKLFCGCCGDTMSGISGTSKKQERYRYYQCMSSKKRACTKKNAGKDFIENTVFDLTMEIFYDKALIKRICDTCYEMQNTKSPQLAALKKQLKQNKKEIDNVMNAVKAGLITKSTKAALEALEQEQEKLEIAIVQEQIARPVLSREQIEFWIMQFAKTDFKSTEQKQKLIDIFVNSITLWDDKLVVIFNFRDGEKCIRFDDVEKDIKKANTQEIECSSLLKCGDPYGN